jgi:hypothetical protein
VDLTPDYVARLVDHHYIQRRTGHFGDGRAWQSVANPRSETVDGWTLATGDGGSVELLSYGSAPSLQNDRDAHGQSSHGRAV